MTEYQRLFLVQAKADFKVFELLKEESLKKKPPLPSCHALHYLQMATEMLGKAYVWKHGPPKQKSHIAFVPFLRSLATTRKAQNLLGYSKKNENWTNLIRKSVPLAESIQNLAPNLAGEGPNPEYPWPFDLPRVAPAEYPFEIWKTLQEEIGRRFLLLLGHLFSAAEAFL